MVTKTTKETKKVDTKVIDATGRTLGRIASEIAISLLGKDKTTFKRNVLSGGPVKIINAAKLRASQKRLEGIYHTRYSGMPGGLRILKGTETVEKKGMKELIRLAVYRMLPSNKLRKAMMKNLTIED